MTDSIERFSSRVENYVRYRPRYPAALIDRLREDCGFDRDKIVADVGSGTGILSELLLVNGNVVIGVEPNAAMREAGDALLAKYPRFRSVNGTAEHTSLADASVDFVFAGQAFHWFNHIEAHREFKRILKPDGWVVLIWNERSTEHSAFGNSYEQFLLQFATDYGAVNQRSMGDGALREFFTGGFASHTLPNQQRFDFEGLKGRLLSSSYAPEPGHARYDAMLVALREVFDAHQLNDEVIFEYDTNLYFGRL